MSNVNIICDNCGRWVQGITWVNGMKFCAKCYQETFGNNMTFTNKTPSPTETFVDLLNKEMYELKIADLEAKLAEKERQYAVLYKLFSEQHEIIDQSELECFEEVNRLLKEQKDFYIVEKVEYDKMKQGAKDIVNQLKQQLAEKDKEIDFLKVQSTEYLESDMIVVRRKHLEWVDEKHKEHKLELLEKVKEFTSDHWWCDGVADVIEEYIDALIKEVKGE